MANEKRSRSVPGETTFVVNVRFHAVPPGTLNSTKMQIEVQPGTTVGELIGLLAEEHPVLHAYARFVSAAVNRAYVGMQTELHDGDEVIYAPPVGGG
jgi:molybdopterin converting factor small subunit